ncbi:uracil-DNA glycosylase [Myxococcota bacterium]|nr:uracil-DNA glycosylase [Myxococcota bacterium]
MTQESWSQSPLAEAILLVRSLREYLLWQESQGWDGVPLSAQGGASFQQRPVALKPQGASSRPVSRVRSQTSHISPVRSQTPQISPLPQDIPSSLSSLRSASLSLSADGAGEQQIKETSAERSISPSLSFQSPTNDQKNAPSPPSPPNERLVLSGQQEAESGHPSERLRVNGGGRRPSSETANSSQQTATSQLPDRFVDLRPITFSTLRKISQQEQAERQQRLDAIHARLPRCEACERQRLSCKQQVLGRGPVEARLMWVYEGPNIAEDLRGQPLQGRAGRILEGMMRSVGLRAAEAYITPIVTCRPMFEEKSEATGIFNPSWEQLQDYTPMLHQKIDVIQPDLIVTLGVKAAQVLQEEKEAKFQSLRGYVVERQILGKDYLIFSMFHPLHLFKYPISKKDAWTDLQECLSVLRKLWESELG